MISDPKQLTVLRKSEGLDKNGLSLVQGFGANHISHKEEEEEELNFGSLLTGGEGEDREKEKEHYKKVDEEEERVDFEGGPFALKCVSNIPLVRI